MYRFPCRFLMSHGTCADGPAMVVAELPASAMASLDRRWCGIGGRPWRRAQTTLRIALGIVALTTFRVPLAAAPPNRLWYEAWEIRAAGVTAEQLPVISEILPADPDVPMSHYVGVIRREGVGGDAGLFVYQASSTRYHLVAILQDDGVDSAPLVSALLTAIRDHGLPAAIHAYATSETVIRTSVPTAPPTAAPATTPASDAACGCTQAERVAQSAPPTAAAPPAVVEDRPRLRAASGTRVSLPTAQPWALTGGELTAGVLLTVALLATLVAIMRIVLLHREQMTLLHTSLRTPQPPPPSAP